MRRFRGADAGPLRESLLRSRDDLGRWIPVPDVVPPREQLAATLDGIALAGRPTYGIAAGDAFVGTAALETGDEPDVLSVAYWLDVSCRGRGYATEAAGALVRLAFDALAALRVEIWCHPDNAASVAVARRLAFARVGPGRPRPGAPLLDRWVREERVATAARAAALWTPLGRYLDEIFGAAVVRGGRVIVRCGAVDVTVTLGSTRGRPFVVLAAPVCAAEALAAGDALEHNATLAVGALVLDGERYLLRHAMPLDGTPGWRLRQHLELLAEEAGRLAAHAAAAPPPPTPPFANYAE